MGSGVCIAHAPGAFAHDEKTKAVVLSHISDPLDVVIEAVEACPTGALRLLGSAEEEGTEA
jgi:ferredoxin